MSRKFWAVLSVLLVAILAITACAPVPAAPPAQPAAAQPTAAPVQPTAAPAAKEPVTLTWAFWGSPEEAVSHKMVADAFMKEHPEIKIETWNEPWDDYFTKIQALWASGDPKAVPDVAFLWCTPKYASEGVLENLDPVHPEVRLRSERLLAGAARVRTSTRAASTGCRVTSK